MIFTKLERMGFLKMTTLVSKNKHHKFNLQLDFDISVLVRNANVKNNQFSVVFSDGTLI